MPPRGIRSQCPFPSQWRAGSAPSGSPSIPFALSSPGDSASFLVTRSGAVSQDYTMSVLCFNTNPDFHVKYLFPLRQYLPNTVGVKAVHLTILLERLRSQATAMHSFERVRERESSLSFLHNQIHHSMPKRVPLQLFQTKFHLKIRSITNPFLLFRVSV